jgi:hypothetical protein
MNLVGWAALFFRRLSKFFSRIAERLQKICKHEQIFWIADAWDHEYRCHYCDFRWFNEIPKLKGDRFFESTGKKYRLSNGEVFDS